MSHLTTEPPRHRPARPALLVALLVSLVLAAACSAGELSSTMQSGERGGTAPATPTGSLEWTSCTSQLASLAGLECATLEVPLDHSDPGGERIELALARTTAKGPASERIGSLVMNPGGPGVSGIEYLANASTVLPAELRERFDLVSFDPRGVGESSPVRCLDDETKEEHLTGDLTPDDDAAVQEALEEHRELVRACEERAGALMRHMGTVDVAADLDLIREALGDEQLTYLGFSYGTAIGAVYATTFPEKVRALVLDGSVSPDADREERLITQGRGFERTLREFVELCDADPACALAPDATAAIDRARRSLAEEPVTVSDPSGERTLGVDLFDLALATALYDTTVWGTTANAIADLREGGAAILLTLVDRQTGREPDGTFDNSTDARAMVNCADDPERPTAEEAAATARRVRDELSGFGATVAWGALGCVDWPRPAQEPPELDASGAAPILVVGTVGDPATPYEWSQQMAEALGPARLLTYEGQGHTALTRGGECVEQAVVRYLVDLELPEEGTRCPAQDDSVSFEGMREVVLDQFVESGLPEPIAACVVDGMVEEEGRSEFDRLMLSDDIDRLSDLVTRHSLRCATGG